MCPPGVNLWSSGGSPIRDGRSSGVGLDVFWDPLMNGSGDESEGPWGWGWDGMAESPWGMWMGQGILVDWMSLILCRVEGPRR